MKKPNKIILPIISLLLLSLILVLGCSRTQIDNTLPLPQQLGAGGHRQSIKLADGTVRTYFIHIPISYDKNKPTPVVFAFHGGGGSGESVSKLTSFNELADKEEFIVMYPDGTNNLWNDGRNDTAEKTGNAADIGFVKAMLNEISNSLNVDSERVYATGISNGGEMAYKVACDLTDKFAAVAPISSAFSQELKDVCTPTNPISLLIMQGTDDPLIPFEGGEGTILKGYRLPARETVGYWVDYNKCGKEPIKTQLPNREKNDVTSIVKEEYAQCINGNKVNFYVIIGGGHTWPGGPQYLPKSVVGAVSKDIEATEVVWNFFKKHKK